MITLNKSGAAKVVIIILATLIAAVGLFMLTGGVYLISLGGSWYFAPAGLLIILAGYSMSGTIVWNINRHRSRDQKSRLVSAYGSG